jgi:hypothetical protein
VRYTQGQVRQLLGLSVEGLRAWREAVPALGRHKGHAPTYTPGELVAFAALVVLTRDFGLRISALSERANNLVELCQGLSWVALEPLAIEIGAGEVRLRRHDARDAVPPEPAIFTALCAPLIAGLRDGLHEPDLQAPLQLQPVTVGRSR